MMFPNLIIRKKLKMVWKITANKKVSYLVGTSHKFSYNFKECLQNYISNSKRVILEGPLECDKLEEVVKFGRQMPMITIYDLLDKTTAESITNKIISVYNKIIPNTFQSLADFHLEIFFRKPIQEILKNNKAWMAFLLIWYEFLELHNWKYSIDIEAYNIAKSLKKEIFYLETIQEQIEALEGVPMERIINFFRQAEHWEDYIIKHEKAYIKGALTEFMKFSEDFPIRCPSIIDNRDSIIFNRMLPFVEEGGSFVAIGVMHIPGIIERLKQTGFPVTSFFEKDFAKSAGH